jgi:hypothetical protein
VSGTLSKALHRSGLGDETYAPPSKFCIVCWGAGGQVGVLSTEYVRRVGGGL